MPENNEKGLRSTFIEALKARILSGQLKPGDKLPPEREIAKEMGISRGSVNQGILDLERMGFLRIVPRQGTFVAEYGKNATPETLAAIISYDSASINSGLFKDLMDLRILIERECTRLACINLSTTNLIALNQTTNAIYQATKETFANAVYQYHKCIVEISGNKAYFMVFQSFGKMIYNFIVVHFKDEKEIENSLPEFRKLTNAIAHRDVFDADNIMHNLLGDASTYLKGHLEKNESK